MPLVVFKAGLLFLWIIFWTGICALAGQLKPEAKHWIIRTCYKGVLAIIGIKVRQEGQLADARPLLLVSNHSSYLDVMVLGAVAAPRFTPKAEVGGWPIIGWICRTSDCIFIDRRPTKTHENQEKLQKAVQEKSLISLFPEGTTNDGKRLLPFRSSYFALAEERFSGAALTVQPVAIAYTRIRNLPIDNTQRHKIAWYGDMNLLPHIKELLQLGRIEVKVAFCEKLPAGLDRKTMAERCNLLIHNKLVAN